jgi:hypothetical protein
MSTDYTKPGNTPPGTPGKRTLRAPSGKILGDDHHRPKSWTELIQPGLAPKEKAKVETPSKVDFILRSRYEPFEGMRRRDARQAFREVGGESSGLSVNSLHREVPTSAIDGNGRRRRRISQRIRDRQQHKGQRAFNREQAAIARDNATVEHLISLAAQTGRPDGMDVRARAALQARLEANQKAKAGR